MALMLTAVASHTYDKEITNASTNSCLRIYRVLIARCGTQLSHLVNMAKVDASSCTKAFN